MSQQQSQTPRICIVIDEVRTGSPLSSGLSGWQWELLRGKILRAGLSPESLPVRVLDDSCSSLVTDVCVGLGEKTLRFFCDKSGVDKWNLSPLPMKNGGIFISTFDFGRIQAQYEMRLYLEFALQRAAEFLRSPYKPPVENFYLNPGVGETLELLDHIKTCPEVAVDIETGYGQINTVGFAWSPNDAIAINVLPDRLSDHSYYELWRKIAEVLENDATKIFQNFMYDTSYFSAYGIETKGEIFDTMHAMKVLWPELDSNLGNVGRIYTRRPYWKDDGKVTDEEGKKKNWGDVRDWRKHYIYNCRDTTGTFAASSGQRADLKSRRLDSFWNDYVRRLIEPVREMCATGMPLDLECREKLKEETEKKVEDLLVKFKAEVGFDLNPRSPTQVSDYLKSKKIALPRKYDKVLGVSKETSDASAIKKIRLKRPEMKELAYLQDIKSLGKALSSYINFTPRGDGRLSYSLNITGTETLRWSGGKDPWDRGFNIQTIPREGGDVSIKSMFLAPEGYSFVEVDLRQAESRFVAYDSADKDLIDMLESGADIHSHVGKAILRQMGKNPDLIPKDEFKATWRQLGKKAGHGLNYGMKASVFVETVFNELDMVITKKDAELITQAYYGLFPGIPRWHAWIRNELYTKRKLTAPSGWERYFYGRPGDDMFKEGAAWRPQHTIPWITNHLMLHLADRRKSGDFNFNFITQVHDSLIILCPDENLNNVAKVCLDHKTWHPLVELPGGTMWITTEVKFGKRMNELEEYV